MVGDHTRQMKTQICTFADVGVRLANIQYIGKIWDCPQKVKSPIVWDFPDIWKPGFKKYTVNQSCMSVNLLLLLSIHPAKWQTALCKTRLFVGQTRNARTESTFAALMLTGCRDVKQLRSANEILRIPFQCQSWREFFWMSFVALQWTFDVWRIYF